MSKKGRTSLEGSELILNRNLNGHNGQVFAILIFCGLPPGALVS